MCGLGIFSAGFTVFKANRVRIYQQSRVAVECGGERNHTFSISRIRRVDGAGIEWGGPARRQPAEKEPHAHLPQRMCPGRHFVDHLSTSCSGVESIRTTPRTVAAGAVSTSRPVSASARGVFSQISRRNQSDRQSAIPLTFHCVPVDTLYLHV